MALHKKRRILFLILFSFAFLVAGHARVVVGVDVFFNENYIDLARDKRVGLITNHTAINCEHELTESLFKEASEFSLVALFCPEHGLKGHAYAAEKCHDQEDETGIPIYSLHGDTRRPTEKMLKGIDLLVFDMQEVGCRSYTYATTLFYVMEEAAKHGIPLIVLDRPNPINGLVVDGPMLNKEWRSFIGYLNIPYCHGMTIGELALLFNEEYRIGCNLKVVPMKGWRRFMSFKDTGLTWVPTSPNIPEADTPFFYATTGIIGELNVVNIGIGYTMPFKLVGAPWIRAEEFAKKLNEQNFPGVKFLPFYYRPFYGNFKTKDCQGVKIVITDPVAYRPLAVQYMILGMLKTLYPKEMNAKLGALTPTEKRLFCQVNGNDEMLSYLINEKYIIWKLVQFQQKQREAFLETRAKYLLY